jgi:hypothetical protein
MVKALLIGTLLGATPCFPLTTDCLVSQFEVIRADAGGLVAVSGPSSNDSGAMAANSEAGARNVNGSLNETPDAASRACPVDGGLAASSVAGSPSSDGSGNRPSTSKNQPEKGAGDPPAEAVLTSPKPADRNRGIYYRNKLEFAFDVGALPINIPFPFDFIEGDPYREHPLKYTLVPIIASLRWHLSDIGGPWIFRGNWDLTSSGSFTWIPSGPETRFISYDMGIRRNFVPYNRNFAPYYEIRLGAGQINAKGPKGVPYAQGEDWPEFTLNMGAGLRYNLSQRYALSAGLNYMHLSNMDLSEHMPTATDPHWGAINYGINVYGPMLGINIRLGKQHPE